MYACDITSTDKQNVCFASLSIQYFFSAKIVFSLVGQTLQFVYSRASFEAA